MMDWADEPLEEREYPDDADLGDDSLARIVPCPHCGHTMHEEAPQCPACKNWVSCGADELGQSGKWYVRGGRLAAKVLLLNWPIALGVSLPALLAWLILGC